MYNLSAESKTGERHKLDISLFKRLQDKRYRFPTSALNIQHRMRPAIANLIRFTLYPFLKDNENVQKYSNVKGVRNNVFFLHHEIPEDSDQKKSLWATSHSHSNQHEVELSVAFVEYSLHQGYSPKEVVVLTPYVGQMQKIKEKLQSKFVVLLSERDEKALQEIEDESNVPNSEPVQSKEGFEKKHLGSCIRVATIDNFQGEEADIVIVSLVRSGINQSVGFLKMSNRINVLLSRARLGMYLLGNSTLLAAKSNMGILNWQSVIETLSQRGDLGKRLEIYCQNHPETKNFIETARDFQQFAPDGGCTATCNVKLPDCGHACVLRCHPDFPTHQGLPCTSPCARLHQPCGHFCRKTCDQKCGDCTTTLPSVLLPCGHIETNVPCYKEKTIECIKSVMRLLKTCGHETETLCGINPTDHKCLEKCNSILPCGHICTSICDNCMSLNKSNESSNHRVGILVHHPCQRACNRKLVCGHYCEMKCHEGTECLCTKWCSAMTCMHSRCTHSCNEPCKPCIELCVWACSHKSHCPLPCGAPCLRLPCDLRCEKRLNGCGHQCPSVCGEPCPTMKYCQFCAQPNIQQKEVYMILNEVYKDICLDEDPIIVLPCNHFFTMSTLDGIFELNGFYTRDNSGWSSSLPSSPTDFTDHKVCPLCKVPIQTTCRYGRVINKIKIDMADKKFIIDVHQKKANINNSMIEIFVKQEETKADIILTLKRARSMTEYSAIYNKLMSPLVNFRKQADDYAKYCQLSPAKYIYDATSSLLKQYQQPETDVLLSLLVPQPFRKIESCGLQLRGHYHFMMVNFLAQLNFDMDDPKTTPKVQHGMEE